jgi:hypothetical protein
MAGRRAGIMRCRTVAVLAAVATVAGCGSSHAKTSATTSTTTSTTTASPAGSGVDSAFRAKAAAICDAAGQALRAEGAFPFPTFDPTQPDPTKFPAIAAYEAKTVAAIRTWQAALHTLGQPSAGSGAWSTFLGYVDRSTTSTTAQQRAANGVGSANNSVPPPIPAAIRTSAKFVAALPICRPLLRIGAVTATTGHG